MLSRLKASVIDRSWCGASQYRSLLCLLLVSLTWNQCGHAQVYTGINQYGIRWFSDTPTEKGAPRVTAGPPRKLDVIPTDLEDHGRKRSGKKTLHKNRRANQRSNPASKDRDKAVIEVKPKGRTSSARRSKASAHPKSDSDRHAQAEARRLRDATRLQKRCLRYENDLRKIRAQMRAGYTAAQGRKLRLRRQDLQTRQFDECPTR